MSKETREQFIEIVCMFVVSFIRFKWAIRDLVFFIKSAKKRRA